VSQSITTVEALLATHTPEVQTLVERLRRIVQRAAPEATETARLRWHSLNYHHPTLGYFCGIFPLQDSVSLLFEFGVLLPDPAGLLRGDGKQVRFVPIRRPGDIRVKAIRQLIRAALDLPADRATRLALIRGRAARA
jgi:hypothetical protein